MLYASKLYKEVLSSNKYAEERTPDDIPDLVAEVLVNAVERRLRRNLSADFRPTQADLTRVRGRIDHLRTERHYLLQQGKLACSFEELTTDTPRNRFVKTALQELTRLVSSQPLARRCRAVMLALERAGVRNEIDLRPFRRSPERTATNGRISSEDSRMLAAAELAFNLNLPTEDIGSSHLSAPDRDEAWARKLFEAAVGGFYDTVLTPQGWSVQTGRRIYWQVENQTLGMKPILPSMKTDIVLEQPAVEGKGDVCRTIIDTKFTEIVGPSQYRDLSLRSGYIYQIYAYLRSQEYDSDPPSLSAAGMLLHPAVDRDIDEAVTIQGHRIRFVTVDLTEDSLSIRNRLLELAGVNPSNGTEQLT